MQNHNLAGEQNRHKSGSAWTTRLWFNAPDIVRLANVVNLSRQCVQVSDRTYFNEAISTHSEGRHVQIEENVANAGYRSR